ncbi:hypothetical protein N9K95_02750 [Schleiferiaceae bacterium]|nr:hypothetical protein [Schleiferiaceae bacterium]
MKFIYAAILILFSNQAIALDWKKRASHKFQDEEYVVYVSTNTSSHERAKLCIEDIFGDPLYEIPLKLDTDRGWINGDFKFRTVFGQRTLIYSHTFHNSTSVAQVFNLDHHDSIHSQMVHLSYLNVERLNFKELPYEQKLSIKSTIAYPVYDTTRFEIVNWSEGVTWDITENGNLSATRVGTTRWYMIFDDRYAPWLRNFDKESMLTEKIENSTRFFEGPWSKHPGRAIPTDDNNLLTTFTLLDEGKGNEWVTVFTAQLRKDEFIRISYLKDDKYTCHSCTTNVRAQIISEPNGIIIKDLKLDIGTAWGKVNSSFRLHHWEDERLLSYELQYGNQGNASSHIYFFDINRLKEKPLAYYTFRVSVDGGIDWNNIPQTVKNEFISCTPFQIVPDAYMHHAIRFYPSFQINKRGNLVLTYNNSEISFEPISWEHCREFMKYTLPDRKVVLEGPMSASPGKLISVVNGRKKKTGFDLEATDGSEAYYEILKDTISN